MLGQPSQITAQGDKTAIDRGDRLTLFPAQVVLEVGDVPGGDAADLQALLVGLAEPRCELAQVENEGTAGVGGEVVGVEELLKARCSSSAGMGAKTLSSVFFTACLSKVDTILTPLLCNWSDKGGYHHALSAASATRETATGTLAILENMQMKTARRTAKS